MYQRPDDDIDFFEFLQSLWDGKWIISIFVAISVLLASVFVFFSETVYESELSIEIYNAPPFIRNNEVFTDFKKNFYSKRNFDEWKKNVSKSSLVFEDFSITQVINGFVMKKPELEQLATINTSKKTDILSTALIKVNSNQLSILEDLFKYANFINQLMNENYVKRALKEIEFVESGLKEFRSTPLVHIDLFLSLNRFVLSAKRGAKLLLIQNPTLPKITSAPYLLVFFFSAVLGIMVGVCFVLICSAIKKRKERLVKT